MEITPNLDLPYIMPSQAQKHVTHNEAIHRLDALVQLSVINRDLDEPPEEPEDGDRYIPASGSSGAWEDWDLNVALYSDGQWVKLVPRAGWRAWVEDEEVLVIWDGAEWQVLEGGGGEAEFDGVGIGTSPDATNRLAVKSDAALFSHDDVTPGSGSFLATVNKAAAAGDAGFVFQNGFSSRALFGLLADDNFTLKVSPDGSQFHDAMAIDKDSGAATFSRQVRAPAFFTASENIGDDRASSVFDLASAAGSDSPFFVFVMGGTGVPMALLLTKINVSGAPDMDVLQSWNNEGNLTMVTDTVLDGTTGDDGDWTLAANNDGTIQWENRLGGSRSSTLIALGTALE